eukprot:IDg2273t1
MRHITCVRRQERLLSSAVDAVRSGQLSIRAAAEKFRIAKSTLHDYVKRDGTTPGPVRRTALSAEEEHTVCDLLLQYARQGVPLTTTHLCDAIEILVSTLPLERRAKIAFKEGRPSTKYCRGFKKRHATKLRFARPLRQESKRFAACNAEILTTHFATLSVVMERYAFDAQRIWNLDETGATPDKDINGRSRCRRFLDRRGAQDLKIAEFRRTHRVTMMPVISAAGQCGPTLFIFKGQRMPYREVLRHGVAHVQTYADLLPRGSVMAFREERGGVDTKNFLGWARLFVDSVRDLTANGRKVLLIFDAYRSHMSLQVIQLFHDNGVVVYALPAHTSGKTQPLDVVTFSVFKNALNEALNAAASTDKLDVYNTFDLCGMLKTAFEPAFSEQNIKSSFARSGIWPLDPSRLLRVPRPAASTNLSSVLSVEKLQEMLDVKLNAARRAVIGEDAELLSCGYVDTTSGAVVTSTRAMQLAADRAKHDEAVRLHASVTANRRAVSAARRREKWLVETEHMKAAAWSCRAAMSGMTVAAFRRQVRPLAERRAIARARTARRGRMARTDLRQGDF